MKPTANPKRPVLFLIAIFVVMLAMPLSANNEFNAPNLTPITVQLKWKHQFQFAGYYAAVAKGFYQQAGFNVTLKEANPKIDPVEEVMSGRADYGVANSELMLYRLNGVPVTALAAFIQHSPVVLMSLKDSNIYSPQDLIGKKVMYPPGPYGANTRGILLREGIELSQIESVPLSFNINDLINHDVDVMVGYVTDQPYLLQQRDIAYNLIDPRNYGIDFYGDTLFTQERRVDQEAEEVAQFRAATIAGWRYAIQHPDEVIDILLNQYHSEKNKDELQYEANATIKLIVPKLVDVGHMNPGRWEHIAEVFIGMAMTDGVFQNDGFIYTPEKEKAAQTLRLFFRVAFVISVIVVLFVAILFYFNKKLKDVVSEKTLTLKRSNKVKDEFLATISHELRTPMNGIINAMQLIRHTSLSDEQNELIHIASQSSDNMLSLIDNILGFTEAQSGSLLLREEPFLIQELLVDLKGRFKTVCNDNGIIFKSNIDSNVPICLVGDEEKLKKLLGYFLENCVKFTTRGTVEVKISIKKGSENKKMKWMQCEVIDTGIGIEEELKKNIFEVFHQADGSHSRRYGGLGMGLSIAKQVCTLMKGTIDFQSQLGKGTHVTIVVPMMEADYSAHAVGANANRKPENTRVLIVEDNQTNQIVLKKIVELKGYETKVAENGQVALDIIADYCPHLVLMDCQMPVMDGFVATKNIRKLRKPLSEVPIIAVTANVMAGDKQRCLEAGMDDYLKKPTNKAILQKRIAHWLSYQRCRDLDKHSA